MLSRQLRSITIEGYKSIRSATVDLRSLNVLVGANGAGKSNFISALALLGRIVDGELNLFVGRAGGAADLLYGGPKVSPQITLRLDFGRNSYGANLIPDARDQLIFEREFVHFDGDSGPRTQSLGSGHRESRLGEESQGGGRSTIVDYVLPTLQGCRVFHFHDTGPNSPMKQSGFASDNVMLQPDARNLAAILARLQDTEPATYQRIVRTIQQVAPFFRGFVLVEENRKVTLRWRQQGLDTVLPADALSDGTLRFICLTTLLSLPDRPAVVVLDEPELGLHPYAIVQLGEMLHRASTSSQILIATQSVTLMDQFEIADLIVVERHDGTTLFDRPDPDRLRDWLSDYSLGELWEKNLLGGRPRNEFQ